MGDIFIPNDMKVKLRKLCVVCVCRELMLQFRKIMCLTLPTRRDIILYRDALRLLLLIIYEAFIKKNNCYEMKNINQSINQGLFSIQKNNNNNIHTFVNMNTEMVGNEMN